LVRLAPFAAAALGLAGCPVGADLEDPERFAQSSGGTASSAGAGTAGSSAPDIPGVDCPWREALTKSCAGSSCHGVMMAYAELLLVPDSGLFDRIKDVPVTLRDVDCGSGGAFVPCTTPPASCMSFVGKKLVDSAAPDQSFMLTKLTLSGCGNQMPIAPGNSPSAGWSEDRLLCLQQMIRGIAMMP
jgi:hypothetical protein